MTAIKKIFAMAMLLLMAVVFLAACGLRDNNIDIDRIIEGAGIRYVTFDKNGGTGSVPAPIPVNINSNDTRITLPDQNGRRFLRGRYQQWRFSKTGYRFGGWNTRADGTGTNYGAWSGHQWNHPWFTVTDNVTLYAQWVPQQSLVVTNIPSGNDGRFLHFDNESSTNRTIGAVSVTGTQANPTVTGVEISGTTATLPMWRFTDGEWQRFSGAQSVSGRLKITNGSTGTTAGRTLSGAWTLHTERQSGSIWLTNESAMVSWPQW